LAAGGRDRFRDWTGSGQALEAGACRRRIGHWRRRCPIGGFADSPDRADPRRISADELCAGSAPTCRGSWLALRKGECCSNLRTVFPEQDAKPYCRPGILRLRAGTRTTSKLQIPNCKSPTANSQCFYDYWHGSGHRRSSSHTRKHRALLATDSAAHLHRWRNPLLRAESQPLRELRGALCAKEAG